MTDFQHLLVLGFPVGPTELFIILAIVLLIFGPKNLPQLGQSIGRFFSNFKREVRSLEDETHPEGRSDADRKDSGKKE